MYVIRVGKTDFVCSGSYIFQGERYQVIGNRAEAKKFKKQQSAINYAEKLIETRANVMNYEIIACI